VTWKTVAIVVGVMLACVVAGFVGGWWLDRMTERTASFWPIAVVVAAAVIFSLGLTTAIAQLDLS
jgi:ABC-type spermidine/putrescine transport system permease subunit I